jgi:hypothetical protein
MSLLDLEDKMSTALTAQFMETLPDWKVDENTYYKYITIKDSHMRSGKRTVGVIMLRLNAGYCKYVSMSTYYNVCRDPICDWNKGITTYEDLMGFEMNVNYKLNQLYGRQDT